jgi:putative transposase
MSPISRASYIFTCLRILMDENCLQMVNRFRTEGAAGLPSARAPHRMPWAITQAQSEVIIDLRRRHPSRGPKQLRAKLLAHAPIQPWPSLSTIGDLLQREGLSRRRKRRRRAAPTPAAVPPIVAPNNV